MTFAEELTLRGLMDIQADLAGEHGPTAAEVISTELVACTLGARSRPELQLDLSAQVREAYARLTERLRPVILAQIKTGVSVAAAAESMRRKLAGINMTGNR